MKQSLLFKDVNKIDKCLARLTKKWGEKGTRCRIRYETYHYRPININKVSEYYEQLSTVITILMSILWFLHYVTIEANYTWDVHKYQAIYVWF